MASEKQKAFRARFKAAVKACKGKPNFKECIKEELKG